MLGIGKGATDDEIKKAYRKRALMHHPGTNTKRAHTPAIDQTNTIAIQANGTKMELNNVRLMTGWCVLCVCRPPQFCYSGGAEG